MNPEDYLHKFIMIESLTGLIYNCGIPYKIEDDKVFFIASINIHNNSQTVFYVKDKNSFIYVTDFYKYDIILPNKDQQKGVIKKLFTYNIEVQ